MKLSEQQIAALKKEHGEDLRLGEIDGVPFVWKPPKYADAEIFGRTSTQSPVMANAHLLQACIVHPDAGEIVAELRRAPAAVGRFIDRFISPLLGSLAEIGSKAL